jgi:hypothetical protein
MKDVVIITGMCAAAILIGAWLYFYGPADVREPNVPPQTQQASASASVPDMKDVSFTVIGHGKSAPVHERKNYAVFTEEDFATLWKQTGSAEKVPVIDFTKAYVVAVFAGDKPTGGYAISVSTIKDAGDARTVNVLIEKPGAGCVTTQEVTSPYQVIRVPYSDASLGHTDTEVETPCE